MRAAFQSIETARAYIESFGAWGPAISAMLMVFPERHRTATGVRHHVRERRNIRLLGRHTFVVEQLHARCRYRLLYFPHFRAQPR